MKSLSSASLRHENLSVTIVMYHYVRPIRKSRYAQIKGLEISDFHRQLDYIEYHYSPISMNQLIEAAHSNRNILPQNPILLTFDDGYLDHYIHVFPELRKRQISGAFFPPAAPLIDRVMLDANKVHFILASVERKDILIKFIDNKILETTDRFDLKAPDAYKTVYSKPSRWDPAEVIYIKRMLQHALPEALRNEIVDDLFRKHVSEDKTDFAEALYVNAGHLREMIAEGMHVGSHGDQHYCLSRLSEDEQRRDIQNSLRIFDAIGISSENFTFCYPYGDYNQTTVNILQELGCSCAVSTRVGLAQVSQDSLYTLARIDTNDLPK